jgi:hypothetical protein
LQQLKLLPQIQHNCCKKIKRSRREPIEPTKDRGNNMSTLISDMAILVAMSDVAFAQIKS